MIDTRFKKLSGAHAGAIYVVIAPYNEVERPLQWMLHMENNDDEKCIVSEEDLADPELWKPVS